MMSAARNENMALETLPEELLVIIFKHVGNLVAVRKTCKKFLRVANDKYLSMFFSDTNMHHITNKTVERFVLSDDKTLLATYESRFAQNTDDVKLYSITLWEVVSGKEIKSYELGNKIVEGIAFVGNEKLAILITEEKRISIWTLKDNAIQTINIWGRNFQFFGLANNQNDIVLVNVEVDNYHNPEIAYLHNVKMLNGMHSSILFERCVSDFSALYGAAYALTDDGLLLAIIPKNGIVKKYNSQLEKMGEFSIGMLPNNNLVHAVTARNNHLIFSRNNVVEIWKIDSGEKVSFFNFPKLDGCKILPCDLSADGSHLLFKVMEKLDVKSDAPWLRGYTYRTLIVFNMHSSEVVNTIRMCESPQYIKDAKFTSNNQILVNIGKNSLFAESTKQNSASKKASEGINQLTFKR